MVHYSSTELGAYVKDKYGYRLTVLDLKGAGLFMVPKACSHWTEWNTDTCMCWMKINCWITSKYQEAEKSHPAKLEK